MKNSRILIFMLFLLSCARINEGEDYRPEYHECIMVNESGVPVQVEVIVDDPYIKFPVVLTLSPGQKHRWTVPYSQDTKSAPIIYYPPLGNDDRTSVKITFNNSVVVQYDLWHVGLEGRNPYYLGTYVTVKGDKEQWLKHTYTFTPEDYQNALKQQK